MFGAGIQQDANSLLPSFRQGWVGVDGVVQRRPRTVFFCRIPVIGVGAVTEHPSDSVWIQVFRKLKQDILLSARIDTSANEKIGDIDHAPGKGHPESFSAVRRQIVAGVQHSLNEPQGPAPRGIPQQRAIAAAILPGNVSLHQFRIGLQNLGDFGDVLVANRLLEGLRFGDHVLLQPWSSCRSGALWRSPTAHPTSRPLR